jgi:Ca-activated chloride channel family protein
VREKENAKLLNQQKSGEAYRYLTGNYEVEALTLPKRNFSIELEADKVKTITIPQPGLVNINTLSSGYGSLFEILPTGESQWVCNLNENTNIHSYNLLPGDYKISFRVKYAGGSKFTAIKTFEVKSGVTLNIGMFN